MNPPGKSADLMAPLRCADPICGVRADCLRWIDIQRQSTPHPVAGSLMPADQSPNVPCPWYLDPQEAGQ